MKVSWQRDGQKLEASYDVEIPGWFSEFYSQIANAYYETANRFSRIGTDKYMPEIQHLVHNYLLDVDVQPLMFSLNARKKFKHATGISHPVDLTKACVMFTSGKDSLHLFLRLIESGKYLPGNILCIYVKNLNRSETHYEQLAIRKISQATGMKFKIVDLANSVKINRTGHNIGLREQLILMLSLPYILNFGASEVYYGLHASFYNQHKFLLSSHQSSFDLVTKALVSYYGVQINVHNHIDYPNVDELGIARDLIERHRDLLNLTSSCYAQINWREKNNKFLQESVPTIKVYNGCGYCLKCLRINGAILLYDKDAKNAPEPHRRVLTQHIMKKYLSQFREDETLTEVVRQLGNL